MEVSSLLFFACGSVFCYGPERGSQSKSCVEVRKWVLLACGCFPFFFRTFTGFMKMQALWRFFRFGALNNTLNFE